MKKILLLIAALVLIGGGYFTYVSLKEDKPQTTTDSQNDATQTEETPPATQDSQPDFTFAQPKKAAHYVSNTPAHGSVLDSAPSEISITFNFDLSSMSTISVTKDGQEVSSGDVKISADKLVLSKTLTSDSGKGLYTVKYSACWPDGSCHDGQFQFGVK